MFFAGLVLEDFVLCRWASVGDADKALIRGTLLKALCSRYSTVAKHARNKLVDAVVRIAERDWPEAFPEFLDGVLGLLGDASTCMCGLHLLEAAVAGFTLGQGRGRVTTDRRKQLHDLVVRCGADV